MILFTPIFVAHNFTNLFVALSSLSIHSLLRKREEYATNVGNFHNLIHIISEHKAEVSTKVDSLTIEKSVMEREKEDCVKNIEQLKQTSQEDVRRMEHEKACIEEQISKHSSVLDKYVAALGEAKEKWIAVYQLLEERVSEYNEYNMEARQLKLISESTDHAEGVNFEINFSKAKVAESANEMLGDVDSENTLVKRVNFLVECYDKKIAEVQGGIESCRISTAEIFDAVKASPQL